MQIFRINEERDNDFTSPQLDSSIYKTVPSVDLPVIFSYFRGGYSEILNNYVIVAQFKNISVQFRYFYVQVSSPPKPVNSGIYSVSFINIRSCYSSYSFSVHFYS